MTKDDKTMLMVAAAAAAGLYLLSRWKNNSNPLQLPGGMLGSMFPSYAAAPNAPAATAAVGTITPSFPAATPGSSLGTGTPFGMVGSVTLDGPRTSYSGPVLSDAEAAFNLKNQTNYLVALPRWGEVGGGSNIPAPAYDATVDYTAMALAKRGRAAYA